MSELTRKKNEASEIMFAMVDSATPANLKSGLTVTDTPYYRDGAGAWTALSIADAATEIGSTGMYTIEMTAAELNHDLILIKLTATGAADTIVIIRTTTHDIDDVNIVVPDAAGVAPTAAEIRIEIEQAGSSIASILADTGTDGVIVAAGSKTGYALSAAGVDAILDEIVEGSLTLRQIQRINHAVLAGKSTGGGGTMLTFKDVADTKARVTVTVDANGNRTAIVNDGT